MIIIVADKIYPKTNRYIKKVRQLAFEGEKLSIAIVGGNSINKKNLTESVDDVFEGGIDEIALEITQKKYPKLYIVALNESALLPAMALRLALGLPERPGVIDACDKARTRKLLSRVGPLAMDYCTVTPGSIPSMRDFFYASSYIVKPVFGTSSRDVLQFSSWQGASDFMSKVTDAQAWLAPDTVSKLNLAHEDTTVFLIEPFIEGTEFSVDGWLHNGVYHAIVQHKLHTIHERFFGDGPTISPPATSASLPTGDDFKGLETSEGDIIRFGMGVLDAIGFQSGVFHIEGRETKAQNRLSVIEVNPRAPGGSLWKTFLLRTGYDLELVDAAIQMGSTLPEPVKPLANYVLHVPFYAEKAGTLRDRGDLDYVHGKELQNLAVDYVVEPGHVFEESDFREETYLAFAVTYDDSLQSLLRQCRMIRDFRRPTII